MLFDDTVQLHRSFSCEQGDYVPRIGDSYAPIGNKSIGGYT